MLANKINSVRFRTVLAIIWVLFLGSFFFFPDISTNILMFFVALLIIYALSNGIWGELKMEKLKFAIIEERENKVLQKDLNGNVKAEINLEKEYKISLPFVGYEKAIYKVKQKKQILEFCTETKNAEHIVKNIFKIKGEYPPRAKWYT